MSYREYIDEINDWVGENRVTNEDVTDTERVPKIIIGGMDFKTPITRKEVYADIMFCIYLRGIAVELSFLTEEILEDLLIVWFSDMYEKPNREVTITTNFLIKFEQVTKFDEKKIITFPYAKIEKVEKNIYMAKPYDKYTMVNCLNYGTGKYDNQKTIYIKRLLNNTFKEGNIENIFTKFMNMDYYRNYPPFKVDDYGRLQN